VSISTDSNAEVLTAVLARAETDVAFRQQLLTNPHRAIHDAFGVRVPADLRLRFIERGADVDALVVLPDLRVPLDELSDVDLERVTGGVGASNARLAWKSSKPSKSQRI